MNFYSFAEWYSYNSVNFKISFPQKPIEENKTMQTLGGEIEVKTLTYKAQNPAEKNLKFYVSVNEIPNASKENLTNDEQKTFLDAAINGSVRNHKATIISDNPITLNKYSGREVKMSMNDNKIIVNMKNYIVKNKYYGLIVYSTKQNDNNSEINQFFKSFEIKDISK
ncbi:hypothetical protein Q764_14470 [Flavobacterium suncheonense GH29-5 = DSM 17707]|uniref:PsbP C-terminal domain-containing protein n=1 Tax=Flavobacterium suncheonense GH29-5 = DSM 17707 TaxID=1121899 RepID=A0A0A2M8G7_9FLAO|nr:hypothetical protein Q764_14470 [Flavobacterium suncheonense GH29-5 = DSM 17707]